jgi:Ca2+-binding EF-hand superfamily protein
MATNIVDAKAKSVFALFDTNGDGSITQDDFVQRANQIRDAFPNNKGNVDVVGQYKNAWSELASVADANHDGKVTREEFDAVLATAGQGSVARALGGGLAEFSLADGDGDGYITRSEFATLLQAYNQSEQDAGAIFDELDRDGDGRVSRQEYTGALEEFFIGSDPSSPIVKLTARVIGG